MRKISFGITAEFLIVTTFMLLLLPFAWLISWLIATGIHELCHYIAIRAFSGRVQKVCIGATGAKMDMSALSHIQKAICCLAGPLGGAALCLLGRRYPVLAISAFVQSTYNLLPVQPLDGGQALKEILSYFLPPAKVSRIVQYCNCITFLLLGIISVFIALIWGLGLWPFLVLTLVLQRNRNTACKGRPKRIQ